MTAAPFEPHWVQRPGTVVERVVRASSVADALAALAQNPAARVIAGGTDLIVDLARSQGPPVELIDVSAIANFAAIVHDPVTGEISIAAGATHHDVLGSPSVIEYARPLAQACLEIGSPQLRNRATVAGNLVTASPANDTISALMALGASVELARLTPDGVQTRAVAVSDFFTGFRQTVSAGDELVTRIVVPAMSFEHRGVWVKLGLRRAQAISVVHVGLWIEFEGNDTRTVVDARIALGSVAATVVLSTDASAELIGRPLDDVAIAAAARAAQSSVTPIDDVRATAEYRSASIATVVARGLSAIAAGREHTTWPARIARLGRRQSAPLDSTTTIHDSNEIVVTINQKRVAAGAAASTTLLNWLRQHAGTGTKEGCAEGECGACTVLVDGAAVMSCLMLAAQADGGSVTTIEGLSDPALSDMQQSFVDSFAVQCGYCIPGFVMAASSLAGQVEAETWTGPVSRAEIEHALAGNLCRCTGYYPIVQAVDAVLNQRAGLANDGALDGSPNQGAGS